jgi:hypothetical protein
MQTPFRLAGRVVLALGLWLLPTLARAQEIRDSLEVSEKLRPEFALAVGAAFPQGDFTREVNTGLVGYARLSYPIVTRNGLSILAAGGASDFSSENQGAIVDTAGNVTSASQDLDYRSAFAHLGLQWTGSWQTFSLRPRLGASVGAHWVETRSTVRVSGAEVDSLQQTTHQTCPGLRFILASDWVLRNNVGLTFEFQIDNVFNVTQYEVSDGSHPADVVEKNVSYVSFLAGLTFPL